MGVGFGMWFPVGWLPKTRRKRYEQYFKNLAPIVPSWNVPSSFEESGFYIQLVPFEEGIYGSWEDGQLYVSARTNSAGPGYHAYLIELMDGLGVKPTEVDDETGYYETRDFSALQGKMTEWLEAISSILIEQSNKNPDASNLMVSLPIDWCAEPCGHFACCPLGYFEKDFFERVPSNQNAGAEFFIWWNKIQDALFFKNFALSMIVQNINWLPPETDYEKQIFSSTLTCLETAYNLCSNMQYPAAEWIELASLLGDVSLIETLKSRFAHTGESTLGYKRGNIISTIGGWKFTHNGKMYFEHDNDGTLVWWDNDRTIRASTLSVELEDGVIPDSEVLLQKALHIELNYETFSLHDAQIPAAIQHSQIEEDNAPLWTTQLTAALENEMLMLSIYYVDETDRDWAISVCASVTRR
jgi:hypothetical protein